MFLPVQIRMGTGEPSAASLYDRSIELTARQLYAFERGAGDMSEPLAQVGGDLRRSVAAQFATQGGQGATGKWTVLSDNPAGHGYASFKESHVPGVPILVGLRRTGPKGQRPQSYEPSGQMRRELLDPLATDVSPRRLLYAPISDIAGWHETGTDTMPARPPVDLSLAFLHSVDRAFVGWLARKIKALGL